MSFFSRLFWAWVCFFKVLFDGAFARRTKALGEAPAPATPAPAPRASDGALQLLGLMQREGRLVDFLEQDVAGFSDADVGAAARVVHDGCRKALRSHAKIARVYDAEEGAKVELADGYDAHAIKLVGSVRGSGPHAGVLQHHGWRIEELTLPEAAPGHDARVVAQAEIEIK